MKIAVSATGSSLDVEVDPRFGRCQCFIIVEPETMAFEAVENSSSMAGGGAGISAAQMVASKGAQVVLTGNCGPNAHQTLSAAGIQIITGVSGKIRDAVEGYKSGQFQAVSQPNVAAHSGMGGSMRRGMGIGRGKGMYSDTMPIASTIPSPTSQEQELEILKKQSQMLAQQLDEMQRRIEGLEKKK